MKLPQFYKSILQNFLELKSSYKDSSSQEFVLFNNKEILLDGSTIFYRNWFDKGVYLIQDLLNVDGKFLRYPEFIEKYHVKCNFLVYLQVTSAIPSHLLEKARDTTIDKTNFLSECMFPLSTEISINLLAMKNKDYYCLFINNEKIELKAKTKWARDLQVDQIPLESYFGDIKSICKDNKLREFYFKLLHRTIVSKKELFIYGIEDNMLCEWCQMNDSIIHSFQNCTLTKQFFSEVIKWFNNENATSLRFSQMEILFGRKIVGKNTESHFVKKLNFTLLYAKYYLYNNKLLRNEISMFDFIANLKQKYPLEGLSV